MSFSPPQSGELPGPVLLVLRLLHYAGCALIGLTMVWISADVALRGFVGQVVPDTHELVAYAVPVSVFLMVPHVLATDGHLLSPLIVDRVPRLAAGALRVLREVAGAVFCTIGAWASAPAALSLLGSGQGYGHTRVLTLPVGLARLVVTVGLALMALIFVWRLAVELRAIPADRTRA